MSELQFKKLERNDSDIAVLRELHSDPSVKKWLSIGDNYFEYCTSTQNVQYIKILLSGVIIGGILDGMLWGGDHQNPIRGAFADTPRFFTFPHGYG